MSLGLISVLPPLLALVLALWKKRIIPALLAGGLTGVLILSTSRWGFFFEYLDQVIRVSGERSNLQLILFGVFVGGLIKLMERAGGFDGMIRSLERLKLKTRGHVYGLTWLIGLFMLLENYSNIMVNGTTVGPLYDRLGISREKMAYFLHSISINFIALIVINSWGAFYMTLLSGQGVERPFEVVLQAMPLNFYCIISLIMVVLTMVFGWNFGAMRRAEGQEGRKAGGQEGKKAEGQEGHMNRNGHFSALYVLIPVVVMVATMLISLVVTGKGSLVRGDGTASVFYAVIIAILVLVVMVLFIPRRDRPPIQKTLYAGLGEFVEVGILLALALTLGALRKQLGTGQYIAGLAEGNVPVFLMPALFFLVSCLISFSTGTSYGTFSIMVPLAIPVALAMEIPVPLMFAACISGGVFGDNTSPFSDTSVITGVSAKIDVVRHVETQLPYALISASVAIVLFVVAGLLL